MLKTGEYRLRKGRALLVVVLLVVAGCLVAWTQRSGEAHIDEKVLVSAKSGLLGVHIDTGSFKPPSLDAMLAVTGKEKEDVVLVDDKHIPDFDVGFANGGANDPLKEDYFETLVDTMTTDVASVTGQLWFQKLKDGIWQWDFCVATLISEQWLLTAGRCVHEGTGRSNWFRYFLWTGPKKGVGGANIYEHVEDIGVLDPWMVSGDVAYDMALVKLQTASPNWAGYDVVEMQWAAYTQATYHKVMTINGFPLYRYWNMYILDDYVSDCAPLLCFDTAVPVGYSGAAVHNGFQYVGVYLFSDTSGRAVPLTQEIFNAFNGFMETH